MKILSVEQIRQADNYTILNEPISSIMLMERAAQQLFQWIYDHYQKERQIYLIAGPGNNGGDALALARILNSNGYKEVKVYLLQIATLLSNDCEENLNKIFGYSEIELIKIQQGDPLPLIPKEALVVDGIFGSGLSRPILGYWKQWIDHINLNASEIIAIDIPSGLFGDGSAARDGAVIKATFTLSFQFPKLAFMFVENSDFVGEWIVLDIGLHRKFIDAVSTQHYLLAHGWIKQLLKPRKKFSHKGTYGHGFLIAGSYQKTGAAVLAARACLRSGIGLLTVHVPQSAYQIMQTAVPEAMLCIDETEMNYCDVLSKGTYNAIGIGPGIGMKSSMQNAFKNLLDNCQNPMVIDADAINIIAQNKGWLDAIPANSILTPHPGEFDRLTQVHYSGFERLKTQAEISKRHSIVIVLKGANTSITDTDGVVYFNATGNPGMATAGSGDVLTGIILALLAQGYKPIDAALIGVYLHGLSGDLAADSLGLESLIASDIIENLGPAFRKIREHDSK